MMIFIYMNIIILVFRNVQKELLYELLTPSDEVRRLQDEGRFTELLVRQEEMKTMPFGDVWNEYCRRCDVPADGEWISEIRNYEETVLRCRT